MQNRAAAVAKDRRLCGARERAREGRSDRGKPGPDGLCAWAAAAGLCLPVLATGRPCEASQPPQQGDESLRRAHWRQTLATDTCGRHMRQTLAATPRDTRKPQKGPKGPPKGGVVMRARAVAPLCDRHAGWRTLCAAALLNEGTSNGPRRAPAIESAGGRPRASERGGASQGGMPQRRWPGRAAE